MVCPLCGKTSEVGMFCQDCYLKKHLKIDLPNIIEVSYCRKCDSYMLEGRWVRGLAEEEAVKRAVEAAIKTNMRGMEKSGLIKVEIEKRETEYMVTARADLEGANVEKRAIVRITKVTCPDCSRMSGGYYEAVIQLRGGVGKKHVDDVVEKISKHRDKFAFVTEIRKVPGGFDLYLGSKKSAEKIVSEFRGKAEIKKSFEPYTYDRQTSKVKSRFCYLIRL